MRENQFQADLIKDIKAALPDSIVLKNDPNYKRGIPDLLVLNGNKWVCLECKRSATAAHQPLQDYYIDKMNKMSYCSLIYPENREEVLHAVLQTLKS